MGIRDAWRALIGANQTKMETPIVSYHQTGYNTRS